MPEPSNFTPKTRRSLVELIGSLPTLITTLIRDEITFLKAELTDKIAKLGVGLGLFVCAAFLLFCVFAVLIAAAILGLAVALPAWLAALIVAFVLVVGASILAFFGVRSIKKGIPPVPEESIESLKKDINAIKGLGQSHE